MGRAFSGTSRKLEQAFEFPHGIDLVYVFYGDGRLELRSEFLGRDPVIRQGIFWVVGYKILHTARWESEVGTKTMVIEVLTTDRLRVSERGITREFYRVPIKR
jgi:hypothetical protein